VKSSGHHGHRTIRVWSPYSGPSSNSYRPFKVPVPGSCVYFLLSVSLFSACPKVLLAIMIMRATTRRGTTLVAQTSHLFKYFAIPRLTSTTTSSKRLAVSRLRTSQSNRSSSLEGRLPPTLSMDVCVHFVIARLLMNRTSCPLDKWPTGNCPLQSRT
jgi:hypothetical protein